MNRRRLVATTGSALLGSIAGCSDLVFGADCSSPWDPEIDGDEPTLSPGDSTELDIDVARTTSLRIGLPDDNGPGEDPPVDVRIGGASLVPSPDMQLDSYPPVWHWNTCTGVSIVLPVDVDERAEPGDYHYTITAGQPGDEGGESETAVFTITVDGET